MAVPCFFTMVFGVGLQQYFRLRPDPNWLNDLLHLSHTRTTARLFFSREPLGLPRFAWAGAAQAPCPWLWEVVRVVGFMSVLSLFVNCMSSAGQEMCECSTHQIAHPGSLCIQSIMFTTRLDALPVSFRLA
jgi:hypothetical protein